MPECPDDPSYTWYHLVVTTYGAWLDGDARGFRTRHHREHVEGDYKAPPPRELYAERRQRSLESLKQPAVSLATEWRAVVGAALVERLQTLGGFVLSAACARQHGHLLAKISAGTAREWTGHAKRHAWFVARENGWTGKMWGKRRKALPVADRAHQLNAHRYILRHAREGAWVWEWKREG